MGGEVGDGDGQALPPGADVGQGAHLDGGIVAGGPAHPRLTRIGVVEEELGRFRGVGGGLEGELALSASDPGEGMEW